MSNLMMLFPPEGARYRGIFFAVGQKPFFASTEAEGVWNNAAEPTAPRSARASFPAAAVPGVLSGDICYRGISFDVKASELHLILNKHSATDPRFRGLHKGLDSRLWRSCSCCYSHATALQRPLHRSSHAAMM